MLYVERPENFNPRFEVVGCFVLYNGKFVLLHRQAHKPEGNTWGIPSGKIEDGENILVAALREVREETGLVIPREEMKFFMTVFVRYGGYDFVYHIFSTELRNSAEIAISPGEHQAALWVFPTEAFRLPLIEDLGGCIKLFFGLDT